LLLLHGLAAAGDGAGAPLGDNHLRAALGAAVSFAYLIRHFTPLCETLSLNIIGLKFDCCQSWWQVLSSKEINTYVII
jgi:hypothetical protein